MEKLVGEGDPLPIRVMGKTDQTQGKRIWIVRKRLIKSVPSLSGTPLSPRLNFTPSFLTASPSQAVEGE